MKNHLQRLPNKNKKMKKYMGQKAWVIRIAIQKDVPYGPY